MHIVGSSWTGGQSGTVLPAIIVERSLSVCEFSQHTAYNVKLFANVLIIIILRRERENPMVWLRWNWNLNAICWTRSWLKLWSENCVRAILAHWRAPLSGESTTTSDIKYRDEHLKQIVWVPVFQVVSRTVRIWVNASRLADSHTLAIQSMH